MGKLIISKHISLLKGILISMDLTIEIPSPVVKNCFYLPLSSNDHHWSLVIISIGYKKNAFLCGELYEEI